MCAPLFHDGGRDSRPTAMPCRWQGRHAACGISHKRPWLADKSRGKGEIVSGEDMRHDLTLLFCDICDSTGLAMRLEPEEYAALLHDLRTEQARIVTLHGGEIVRVDGDGLLAMFGYPVAHEDCSRRAVEAALDLHAAAQRMTRADIRLHSGIHAGTVLLRTGDLVRGRYEVLGDATNVAARLCDAAGRDEIIASNAALGADQRFFITGPLRRLGIGGPARQIMACTVAGRQSARQRPIARGRHELTALVGRAAERAALQSALADCRSGPGRLVLLVGPAGIGKTRLASAFLAEAQAAGAVVLRGYCEAYLGAQPLQPFIQMAGDDGTASPDVPHAALAAHVRGRLGTATPSAPVIVLIDDWQWADDASRNLLGTLLEALPAACLVLLATRSVPPELADAGTIITLAGLNAVEAGGAITALLPAADPFQIDRICADAGGNPLFIEELCHASASSQGVRAGDDRTIWLDMLIQARFARLPARQADVLIAAAVLGHVVPLWLFEAVTGVAGDDPLLQALAAEDFLYGDPGAGRLQFKHGLTRDAIYRWAGLAQRQALHRRVVEALQARSATDGEDGFLEALAYHHAAAGNPERAAHYSLLAGDKAMAAAALDRAQAHYRVALDVLGRKGDPQSFYRAIHRFGFACVADPAPDQLVVLETAATQAHAAGNSDAVTLCRYWLGTINYGLGQSRASVAHLMAALSGIDNLGNARLKLQLQANLGQSHSAGGDYVQATQWLDKALADLAAAKPGGMEAGWAYALACRGFLFADQGDFAAAAPLYAQAERLLDGQETPLRGSVVTQQAAVAIWQGDWATALRHAAAGMAIGQRTRSRYYVIMSRALAAYARWCSGDTAALDDLARAAAWFTSATSQQRSSLCFGWLAQIMADQGRGQEARRYAALALQRARQGDVLGDAMAWRALAVLAARGQGRRTATSCLARADQAAQRRQSPRELALNRALAARLAASR